MPLSLLKDRLEDAAGTSVTLLSEARSAFRGDPEFLNTLTACCLDPDPAVSAGATWILKAELEDGTRLPPPLAVQLVRGLDRLTAWQAMLHICQCTDYLDLARPEARSLCLWAEPLTGHKRPFVRAWALHARVTMGLRHAALMPLAEAALAQAADDPAASVRARARKLSARLSR
jgi:hypothetical protein